MLKESLLSRPRHFFACFSRHYYCHVLLHRVGKDPTQKKLHPFPNSSFFRRSVYPTCLYRLSLPDFDRSKPNQGGLDVLDRFRPISGKKETWRVWGVLCLPKNRRTLILCITHLKVCLVFSYRFVSSPLSFSRVTS